MQKILVASTLILLLAACGQKGNLFLPEDRHEVPAAANSSATPATAAEDADDEARRRATRGANGN